QNNYYLNQGVLSLNYVLSIFVLNLLGSSARDSLKRWGHCHFGAGGSQVRPFCPCLELPVPSCPLASTVGCEKGRYFAPNRASAPANAPRGPSRDPRIPAGFADERAGPPVRPYRSGFAGPCVAVSACFEPCDPEQARNPAFAGRAAAVGCRRSSLNQARVG